MTGSFDETRHLGRRVDRQAMRCEARVRGNVFGYFTRKIQFRIGVIGQRYRQQIHEGDDPIL
ncbi:hypothetical protein [Variovorax sp. LG9.2]|uniref:hypothetical protein n=1 Tax=Variovorax sp. LG9.2 TaxID=3048626 RepID=UPI002B239903|nr:hypothetical protein [Variovorax sp. LG9.2]